MKKQERSPRNAAKSAAALAAMVLVMGGLSLLWPDAATAQDPGQAGPGIVRENGPNPTPEGPPPPPHPGFDAERPAANLPPGSPQEPMRPEGPPPDKGPGPGDLQPPALQARPGRPDMPPGPHPGDEFRGPGGAERPPWRREFRGPDGPRWSGEPTPPPQPGYGPPGYGPHRFGQMDPERLFKAIDTNGDGVISRDEFMKFHARMRPPDEPGQYRRGAPDQWQGQWPGQCRREAPGRGGPDGPGRGPQDVPGGPTGGPR